MIIINNKFVSKFTILSALIFSFLLSGCGDGLIGLLEENDSWPFREVQPLSPTDEIEVQANPEEWIYPTSLSDNISPDGSSASYPFVQMDNNGNAIT